MTTQHWHGGQLRWNHWSTEWAVIAPGRRARPHDATGTACPFCPGAGQDTPPETWRLPTPDGTSWRVRAVPNRYALSDHHEVVIESPDHDWDMATATDDEITDVLHAWQVRHRALRTGAAQVLVFRNRGTAAGTSLPHPHSQLVGLPLLSAATNRKLDGLLAYHRRTGRRFSDDLIAGELAAGTRIVLAGETATAFVPFAPTTEYELHIAPRVSRADFTAVPHHELTDIATVLRTTLAALRVELEDPAYNLVVHTAPTNWEHAPFLAWHLRILPRLTIPAGLELATGIPVLTTTPEQAADRLRANLPAFAGV